MPEIPAAIRKAAHDAATLPFAQAIETSPYQLIDLALDAVAPLFAAAVAEKILAHMKAHCPAPVVIEGDTGESVDLMPRYRWHRHMGIAAQVACRAFTTREEELQQAVEALAAGNYAACPAPEGGQ